MNIVKYVRRPLLAIPYLGRHGLFNWIPDEPYIKLAYRANIGCWPNLESPDTFNEKIQWLKLHDRNPLYTKLVDKIAVKDWVAERIGSEHVVPTLAVWDKVEDIDLAMLPERFVLKTNHYSGDTCVCADRSVFDFDAAKKKLARSMRRNLYWWGREWPYKDVRPCVFAERYLEGDGGDLRDYKLFHFSNGRIVTLLMTDRFSESALSETFFNESWEPLEVSEGGHPRKPDEPAPRHFKTMLELTRILAKDEAFLRVDFYESAGRLYLGELTFYPNCGYERFDPPEWDLTFGSWIDLGKAWGSGDGRGKEALRGL